MACKWVWFAYRTLPLTAWRAFLLRTHIERCPGCQGAALDDAAIHSLGVTPADLENEPPLFPFAAGGNAQGRRPAVGFRWSYGYGFFLAGALLWAIIAVWRLVPPAVGPQGTVTVVDSDDETRIFAVGESRVGGEPARPVIFKPGQPGLTIVWFEKKIN